MNKQILLLSVAVAALAASPAFAPAAYADPSPDWTDITTALTVPIDTAHAVSGDPTGTPGDILIETGGSVTVATAGAAVTINSDNAFSAQTGSSVNNKNTSDATGILVDLTTAPVLNSTTCATSNPCFTGITFAALMDMTGTGDTKKGLWLEGSTVSGATTPNVFIGNIDFTGSTMTITGDTSTGIQIDSLAELQGNLTIGAMTIKPSSTTSTATITGADLEGAVYGDITLDGVVAVTGTGVANELAPTGIKIAGNVFGNVETTIDSSLIVAGVGAQGILITGNIAACDVSVVASCDVTSSRGALVNRTIIETVGSGTVTSSTNTATTGNPIASNALAVGGSVAGGIYNAGKTFADDDTAAASLISFGSVQAFIVSPILQGATPVSIEIDPYSDPLAPDPDPGFAIYNRGTISGRSPNNGDDGNAMFIGGASNSATTTVKGGFFNSGSISTAATSLAATVSGARVVNATAIHIGGYAFIGADETYTFTGSGVDGFTYGGSKSLLDDRAAFVNTSDTGGGLISAVVGGPLGGIATAIQIDANAQMPSIINSGQIVANASTSDTTIGTLAAFGILDDSGSLTYIQNNGTISAVATTLDNGAQVADAIALSYQEDSNAGQGVLILDQATASTSAIINGNIIFGSGQHQVVDVEGFSTEHGATVTGDITYGGGSNMGSDQLTIGEFGTVTGAVMANAALGVSVDIRGGGTLNLQNDTDTGALTAYSFLVEPTGTLNLTVKESFTSGIINTLGTADNTVEIDNGANLNITYGSFVPANSEFVLISAHKGTIQITQSQIDTYNGQLGGDDLPFLFDSSVLSIDKTDPNADKLVLTVTPKSAQELGLVGYAAQILPFANVALSNDDTLGSAFVEGIANKQQAQTAYNEMAPDVSGGARAIAIALTDQSSGPVAARQRILRMYGKASGETTLWGEEFAEFVQDPGDRATGQTGFKDHGFGFVLGLDAGDPKTGWYGGAFSFYSGDIVEPLPRDSHTNTSWYMLTGYTDWRGRGLFLDTKVDIGYMDLTSKRFVDLTIPNATGTGSSKFVDEADGKRPGLVGALGMTTGAVLAYGSTVITPQVSIDGMSMREEGFTETHASNATSTGNGKGLLLQSQAYYANSARIFVGTEIREDLNLGDFFVQPDLRVGYRYDFLNDPTKLKVNFADVGTNSTPTPGQVFTVVGPDPAQGNFVAGASLATTTDAWTLGANFDFVRGTNGATTEVGTIHLLGRI